MYKDYHLHLSGATDPTLLWEIIKESGLKSGAKGYREFEETILFDRAGVTNLDQYLKILHTIDETQSSPSAVERSVFSAYKHASLTGCEYLELRWNVVKRSRNGRVDLDSLIVAARAGYERAKSVYGIKGGLILCLGRDCSEAENEAIFKKAVQYAGKGVIGIDIAGPETGALPPEFAYYFKMANASGELLTTVHAGESNHPGVEDELAYVLEKLQPVRIGHGIQLHRFPHLLAKAASASVQFEICISSNLATRVATKEEFPTIFKGFEDHGIKYHICTDSTFLLKTDITKEHHLYHLLRKQTKVKK